MVGAAALIAAAASTISDTGHGADHANAPTRNTATPSPGQSTDDTTRHGPGTAAATTAPTDTLPQARRDLFSLVVTMRSAEISTAVAAISVASNEPVDPPHATAAQWNTAVWVKQSSFPSPSSRGTSYVYGHACHHHVCSFTELKDVSVGDRVTVTTPSHTLTYRVAEIGVSPKAASSLPSWASRSNVPNRLVLVTCAYEQGDTSTENLVVVAQLQPA